MNSVLKMIFFCVVTFILSWPYLYTLVGNWDHIIFASLSILFLWYFPTIKKSFTLTIIKAKEKIAQNTNNLLNLFHGQAQVEYYLVGPNIVFMIVAIFH